MTPMVQVIRPPRCPTCGARCGIPDHYAAHWLESCRRKVTYISADGAIDHALDHVASGRFHGWHRHNDRRVS